MKRNGWRKLEIGEMTLATDAYADDTCGSSYNNPQMASLQEVAGTRYMTGRSVPPAWHGPTDGVFRKIEESPWISVKDQMPARNTEGLLLSDYVSIWKGASYGDGSITLEPNTYARPKLWMPIPALPAPKEETIVISEGDPHGSIKTLREVQFNASGSVTVGCTTIPKETMEKIVERWQKKQESGQGPANSIQDANKH